MSARETAGDPILAAVTGPDVAAAARAARELARRNPPYGIVQTVLNAAINRDDPVFLDAAAALSIAADLPPQDRIRAAWRLGIAGFGERALPVLLCDPRMLTDPSLTDRVFHVLGIVQANAKPGSLAREQAQALTSRFLPLDRTPRERSPHAFGGAPDAPAQIRGTPVKVHPAPGVAPVIHTQTTAHLTEFDKVLTSLQHPQVHVLSDVFVNRFGQIWRPNGTAVRHYNRLIPQASQAAQNAAPRLDDAVLGIEMHNNIFHWLAECFLTLAWRLDDAGATMPVLIREDPAPFVAESIALGAADRVPILAVGDAVFVRRLHMTDAHLGMLARPGAVDGPLQRMRASALAAHPGLGDRRRPIYISRRDSRKRPMANEAELEAALVERGFAAMTMTGRPLAEQIALITSASGVVAAHGAGLALLATAAPGLRVLEFVPAMRGGVALRTNMAKISRILGHRHEIWLQDTPLTGAAWSLPLDSILRMTDEQFSGPAS